MLEKDKRRDSVSVQNLIVAGEGQVWSFVIWLFLLCTVEEVVYKER